MVAGVGDVQGVVNDSQRAWEVELPRPSAVAPCGLLEDEVGERHLLDSVIMTI